MKIVFCVQQLFELGGTEVVSIQLANALAEKGHDVEVVSMSEIKSRPSVYSFSDKVKLTSLNLPFTVLRFENRAPELLKKFRIITFLCYFFRLLHHNFWKVGIYRKRLFEKIKDGGTMVCTSLDSYRFASKKGKVVNEFHFSLKEFQDGFFHFSLIGARKPDAWVFLSKTTLDEIQAAYPKLKDSSTYIYNPIRYPGELHLEEAGNNIVFLGRYMPQKNPLLALATAKILKQEDVSFHLNMYGNGVLRDEMDKFVEKEGLEDVVTIHDATSDVKSAILSSDLLFLTSEYEGWPLIIGEANALSRPVITSEFGPTVHEMVEAGKNGWVVPSKDPKDFADKIRAVLENPEQLKEAKKQSYEHSLRFGIDAILAKWEEVLS